MHRYKKIAAGVAAAGLTVGGIMAWGGGTAAAATSHAAAAMHVKPIAKTTVKKAAGKGDPDITGCSVATIAGAVTCTTFSGPVANPISLTVSAPATSFGAPTGITTIAVTGTLTCEINNTAMSTPIAASLTAATPSAAIAYSAAWPLPVPKTCTITALTATATATGVGTLTVTVSGSLATPGAMWLNAGTASSGAAANTCADDRNNSSSSGAVVQNFVCRSALSQGWVLTGTGQFAHNGLCLTAVGGNGVILSNCSGTLTVPAANQTWRVYGSPANAGLVSNSATGTELCLATPSFANSAQLRVEACNGSAASQLWTVPGASV